MKKLFTYFLLLMIPCLVNAQEWVSLSGVGSQIPSIALSNGNSGSIVAHIHIDGFWKTTLSTPRGNMNSIGIEDGSVQLQAGLPDVQHLTLSLMLSERGSYRLNVNEAKYTDFNIQVAPSKGDPQYNDLSASGIRNFDESIRQINAFYPATIAEAGHPYIWCDSRGIAIQVYPFAYNPVSGVLRVFHDITLELEMTNGQGFNEISRYSGAYGRQSGLSTLQQDHFLNYTENNRYTPIVEGGSMLIVAPENFRSTLQPFMDWKTRCGIVCEFADAATFQAADQIRELISERYYSQGLTYLLLAGDVAQVPTNQAENGASDNMYGYVAGDDHYPEVLVGRFPAENTQHLATMVVRTIDYEMLGNGGNTYSNFLGIASQEGPGDDNEMDFEHIRNIGKALQNYTYTTFTELYDGAQGENDLPGNPTGNNVENAVNAGQGLIMYVGHGASGRWTTSEFSGENIARLTNTKTHPFIWSAGCSTGDFSTTTCLAEKWLRAEKDGIPIGAVAVMMSTSRQSWYPPMEAQDEMALILSEQKELVNTRTFGGISMSGCMKMNDKYGVGGYLVTDTWNIFGDPSVVVRTSMPAEISAHHAQLIGADAREFVVKLPVPEAMACITYNGKLYGAGRAQEGMVIIPLDQLPQNGSLQLTITAFNHKPYIANINITNQPAIAFNPQPLNFAGKISPYTDLSWSIQDGTVPAFFEVVISDNPELTSPIATMVAFNPFATPELPLHYATTYYWKVISHNNYGTSESRIYNFTTSNPPDEDFENQGFPRSNWLNSGDFAWFIDGNNSFEGKYSLRSANVNENESSRLAYTCYSSTCDYLGFRVKVSSQQNADILSLVIDGATVANYSGEVDWNEERFAIDAGEHLIEWIFTKNESGSAGLDAAWIDNIYLPGNEMTAVALEDVETCPGHDVDLSVQASGSSHVEWLTAGTGTFDDINSHYPVYIPSDDDLNNGFVMLHTDVYNNDFCSPARYSMMLTFLALPELPAINDTVLYAGEEMEIILPAAYTGGYKLSPVGDEGSRFLIKADELNEGENILTISCENEGGCAVQKSFTVTVIKGKRPVAGEELLIYPNPAGQYIAIAGNIEDNGKIKIMMFNISGQLVLQSDQYNAMQNSLDISVLPEGIYMVRIENGREMQNGRFIKTM
jgi:hypothetical protein